MHGRWRTPLLVLLLPLLAAGCAEGDSPSLDDEYGMMGPLSPTPPPGKQDGLLRRGLLVATDTRRTQVWNAVNRWEDTDTAAARAAGVAWGEDSGLDWDQKYALWIQSMPRTTGVMGYPTFILTTPWGKTLESPALECAELSIFLRITFAAWYGLPFYMEAIDSSGARIYFGHNGVRTAGGRYASTPEYALVYRDHSAVSPDEYLEDWPEDAVLRERALAGGEDEQPMVGEGATTGTYLDEIHLNKRAGHFIMLALNYLGSANLADPNNAYNIVPEAVRAGDSLVERWQRVGIGHTLVVKDVTALGEGSLDTGLVSGSMPRRQGKWESGVVSKTYFTDERTGGEGTNFEGDQYARLGGGLKRWRVTKNIDGYWTNTFMAADEAHWIDSNDLERIAARPARFELLLGQIAPEDARDGLLGSIADARRHLASFPASCAARERRERAFAELYDLMAREFGTPRREVDRRWRSEEDYVFAELEYTRSRTCCWNSSTAGMHDIVVDLAASERSDADAEGTCRAPSVFMSQPDGYERWRSFAAATGRAAEWRPWSEDESCPQRGVAVDTARSSAATSYCDWRAAVAGGEGGNDGGGGNGCSDPREPNDDRANAATAGAGALDGLAICTADVDWFTVAAGGTVRIDFQQAVGDLDMAAFDGTGTQMTVSQSTTDSEQVFVPAGGAVKIYGYQGATGPYRLTVD
jgi:hypothetical protein